MPNLNINSRKNHKSNIANKIIGTIITCGREDNPKQIIVRVDASMNGSLMGCYPGKVEKIADAVPIWQGLKHKKVSFELTDRETVVDLLNRGINLEPIEVAPLLNDLAIRPVVLNKPIEDRQLVFTLDKKGVTLNKNNINKKLLNDSRIRDIIFGKKNN